MPENDSQIPVILAALIGAVVAVIAAFGVVAGVLALVMTPTELEHERVEVTAEPTPAPVSSNAAWTPVIHEFDGVDMAQVPPGCFEMGHDDGRRDERPTHEFCFDAPFWIDRYEVTNAQYGESGNFTGGRRPRENLTWFEARDYCLNREARLPTEAEWEYAASGPDNMIYPWGNAFDNTRLIYDSNYGGETQEVNSRPDGASWVGALDMAGNVWEWVSSVYMPYPYNPMDGREAMTDTESWRVYRGGLGSYIDYGTSTAKRFRAAPDYRNWFIGFRCVRDVEGASDG
jgi:formylglycine-generating enzyme required for sulfatase activity